MVRLLKIKCSVCQDEFVPHMEEIENGEIQCPTCGTTVKIEVEQIKIGIPKVLLDFIKEFAEWLGEDEDEFLEDTIIQAVASRIWSDLDDLRAFAPTKVRYFAEKYNFFI